MLLGLEERLEHARKILRRNSASAVGDRDFDETIDGADRDRDPPSMRRRLACVAGQVQEYLFEIALTAGDFRSLVRHMHVQLDVAPTDAVLQDGRRRLEGASNVAITAPPRRIPRN